MLLQTQILFGDVIVVISLLSVYLVYRNVDFNSNNQTTLTLLYNVQYTVQYTLYSIHCVIILQLQYTRGLGVVNIILL